MEPSPLLSTGSGNTYRQVGLRPCVVTVGQVVPVHQHVIAAPEHRPRVLLLQRVYGRVDYVRRLLFVL